MPGHLARSPFRAQKLSPDLRTIPVRDDDSVAGPKQSDNLDRCPLGVCPLFGDRSLFARPNQGISANRKEHGLHTLCCCYTCINSCNSTSPGNLTNSPFISSSMIAFCECNRFSAC